MIEIIKAIILGIVEGITEWLPISSTGHMILVDEFLRLGMSDAFKELFLVAIQLGAILAVIVLYWRKLFPVSLFKKNADSEILNGLRRAETMDVAKLWLKVIIACVPAAVIGFMFDDKINAHFFNYQTVAAALIFYGALFLVVERWRKDSAPRIDDLARMDYKTALIIGLFQTLALIPGTSRSGATILGAMIIGTSRTVAAEFTFYLAIPVMLGASLLKMLKFGLVFSGMEVAVLLTGAVTAFIVSVFAIKFLVSYVKKHDFKIFGWYRIALGVIVFAYFGLFG